MRSAPIIFTAESIGHILAGTKTQTRRLMTPQPPRVDEVRKLSGSDYHLSENGTPGIWRVMGPVWAVRELMDGQRVAVGPQWRCPYGTVGDRLWVSEAWRTHERPCDLVDGIEYAADASFRPIDNDADAAERWIDVHDNGKHGQRWRSSLYMPRWASRLELEVESVKVALLHTMTEDDAIAEGCTVYESQDGIEATAREQYAWLWNSINADRALWASNPFVWAVTFRRCP